MKECAWVKSIFIYLEKDILAINKGNIFSFSFHKIKDYKLPHKLDISNGFPVIRDSNYGFGRRPTDAASLRYVEYPDPVE